MLCAVCWPCQDVVRAAHSCATPGRGAWCFMFEAEATLADADACRFRLVHLTSRGADSRPGALARPSSRRPAPASHAVQESRRGMRYVYNTGPCDGLVHPRDLLTAGRMAESSPTTPTTAVLPERMPAPEPRLPQCRRQAPPGWCRWAPTVQCVPWGAWQLTSTHSSCRGVRRRLGHRRQALR